MPVFLRQLLGKIVKVGATNNLVRRQSKKFAVGLVGKSESSLPVATKNALGHGLHQGMVEGFGSFQRLGHLPLRGDILDGAFVVKQFALCVADGAAVFLNPDNGFVLAINLRLEPAQGVVLLHEPHKFLAATVVHVKAVGDVLDARHQLHRRVIAVYAGERDVR